MGNARRAPGGGRHVARVLAVLAFLGAFAGSGAGWAAGDPAVTLTVLPDEITLAPGAAVSGTLVVSNSSDVEVSIDLEAQASDPSMRVDLTSPTMVLTSHGSHDVGFTVTWEGGGAAQATSVQFVARYTVKDEASVSVATAKVAIVATPALMTVELKSDLKNVNEYRPGEQSLLVTNSRDDAIEINSITVQAPKDIAVSVQCATSQDVKAGTSRTLAGCTKTLEPHEQWVVPIALKPASDVTPGDRTLLVSVSATSPDGGQTSSLAATDDFTVDVFAEAELLKAVGVPIFLLFPGAVIVLFSWLLIKHATRFHDVPGPALSLNSLALGGILMIATSLGFAWLYPRLTDLFPGRSRNYLRVQGLEDFGWVLGWGTVVALAIWLLVLCAAGVLRLTTYLVVLQVSDRPDDIVRKVVLRSRFRGPWAFARYRVGADPPALKALRLKTYRSGEAFLAPQIRFAKPPPGSPLAAAASAYRSAPSGTSLRALNKQLKKSEATLSWAAGTWIPAAARHQPSEIHQISLAGAEPLLAAES